jgi:hypothetical protein
MLKEEMFINYGNGEVPTISQIASRFFSAGFLTSRYYQQLATPNVPFAVADYIRHYKSLSSDDLVTDIWNKVLLRIEAEIQAGNTDLLKIPIIANAIFSISNGGWERLALKYLERRHSEQYLASLLPEDAPLQPIVFCEKYSCSETTLIHLAQLETYSETMGVPLEEIRCVVEFGGGYGSMTRLLRKLNPGATIIVVDLPIMLVLQHYFLTNIFGADQVKLCLSDAATLTSGAINLVPIFYPRTLDAISGLKADLFIACFSLSETTDSCQQLVHDKDFFGAKDLLLSYFYKNTDTLPYSTNIKVPDSYVIRFEGPAVFSNVGDQLHKFARRR